MDFGVSLHLPSSWEGKVENEQGADGSRTVHVVCREAVAPGGVPASIEAYIAEIPDGETPADQAFENYVDMVGFDEGDDFDPIVQYKFGNRKAWGFDALGEDESPMRVLCAEPRQGILSVICLTAGSDAALEEAMLTAAISIRVELS